MGFPLLNLENTFLFNCLFRKVNFFHRKCSFFVLKILKNFNRLIKSSWMFGQKRYFLTMLLWTTSLSKGRKHFGRDSFELHPDQNFLGNIKILILMLPPDKMYNVQKMVKLRILYFSFWGSYFDRLGTWMVKTQKVCFLNNILFNKYYRTFCFERILCTKIIFWLEKLIWYCLQERVQCDFRWWPLRRTKRRFIYLFIKFFW